MTKLADLKNIKKEMEAAGVEILGTVYNQPGSRFGSNFFNEVFSRISSIWSKKGRSEKGIN